MNRSKCLQGWVLVIGLFVGLASAYGAVAPYGFARDRLVEVRGAAGSVRADVSVTLTSGELKEYRASAAALGGERSWTMTQVGGEERLVVGSSAPDVARLLWLMVLSDNPLGQLGEWAGEARFEEVASVEVHDGDLVYSYGEATRVWVSRDLSRLLRVEVTLGSHRWDAVATGRAGESWLPEVVNVSRDGQGYAVMRLSIRP
jgi:hypothetical protein